MNIPFKITSIALIATLIPALADAQTSSSVTILTDAESLQQRNEKQYFSQDGLSGEEARVVPGAGAGMPLKAAAKILVPAGWQVVGSGEFDKALISWRGGLAWPQILRDIAQREKIFISLDWVKKIASINVPNTHATLAQTPSHKGSGTPVPHADRNKDSSPNITTVRSPEPAGHAKLITETPAKLATSKLAAEALEKAKLNVSMQKDSAANKNKDDYISKLERERDSLVAKNQASQQEAQRKEREILALKKYQPSESGVLIDAAKMHQQYRERSVLPFNSSFEYFANGGHSDRFKADVPATFVAKPGTVEQVINSWADMIGYGVEYRAGVQHNNDYQVEIKGTFFEASTQLIRVFENSDRPLNIEFYPDVQVSETKKGLVIISDLRLN